MTTTASTASAGELAFAEARAKADALPRTTYREINRVANVWDRPVSLLRAEYDQAVEGERLARRHYNLRRSVATRLAARPALSEALERLWHVRSLLCQAIDIRSALWDESFAALDREEQSQLEATVAPVVQPQDAPGEDNPPVAPALSADARVARYEHRAQFSPSSYAGIKWHSATAEAYRRVQENDIDGPPSVREAIAVASAEAAEYRGACDLIRDNALDLAAGLVWNFDIDLFVHRDDQGSPACRINDILVRATSAGEPVLQALSQHPDVIGRAITDWSPARYGQAFWAVI